MIEFVNNPERAFNKAIPSTHQTPQGWSVTFSVENVNDLIEVRLAGTTQITIVRKWMVQFDPHTGEMYMLGQNIGRPHQQRYNIEFPWLPETRADGYYKPQRQG